jgi:uncharacterized protein (TIGR03437 family)
MSMVKEVTDRPKVRGWSTFRLMLLQRFADLMRDSMPRRSSFQAVGMALWLGVIAAAPARSQSVITTVVGTGYLFPSGLAAARAPIGDPPKVSVDLAGNVYICSASFNVVIKVGRDGVATVVAGNGIDGFSGEGGPATSASLSQPSDVAFDSAGNMYIADSNNNRIRKVDANGIIRTIAGNGRENARGDGGPALAAGVDFPIGLAFDAGGNLYESQYYEDVVRKITPDGIITTVAGNGNEGFSGDGGPATAAMLDTPYGIAVDSAGNLYIADLDNGRIRKVSPNGIITTAAGNGDSDNYGNGGPATQAAIVAPSGVAVDASGNLYIADAGSDQLRKVNPDVIISLFAGTGSHGFSGDGGPAIQAELAEPTGVAVDTAGNVYFTDAVNRRVRVITPNGIISTFAGNGDGRFAGDGDSALRAAMDFPGKVAFDSSGNLYISDTFNYRVRKVTPAGVITTVAGNGLISFGGDGGPGPAASLDEPYGLAIDRQGNLYIADRLNHRIRKVAPDGTVSIVAGNGKDTFAGDGGPAASASLKAPEGVAVDTAGNLYIADRDNYRIRKVSTNGIITTFAGNGTQGFSGDGGPALSASLNRPADLAFDNEGNLYVADTDNQRIREITTDGIIRTVAGTGNPNFTGDGGLAISATFRNPSAIAIDPARNIYIADADNNRLRRIDPAGVITTIAGNDAYGLAGDGGPPANALLFDPLGVAASTAGDIYIADTQNNRIRAVLRVNPLFGPLPSSVSLRTKAASTNPASALLSATSSLSGLLFTSQATTTDGQTWLQVVPPNGALPAAVEIRGDASSLNPGTYQGTVLIQAPAGNPGSRPVAVTFTVDPGDPPSLQAQPDSLAFALVQGSAAQTKALRVINAGVGSLAFQASVTSSGTWLTVSPASASVTAATPASLTVAADPSMLAPGTYTGAIILSPASGTIVRVPVTMTISAAPQTIVLSQAGFSFTTAFGGGAAPAQRLQVLNSGQGNMNWAASVQTATGSWLRIHTTSGSSGAFSSTAPEILVSTDATGLSPGRYYGRISISASNAANSPQYASVVLNVLNANSTPPPVLSASRLVFVATAGGTDPSSQNLTISNVSTASLTFTSSKVTNGGNWLTADPTNGSLPPGTPARIVVQPVIGSLSAGTYTGSLDFQFSDGSLASVRMLLILTTTTVLPSQTRGAQAGCVATQLFPAFAGLPSQFSVPAAWPVSLLVDVVDDCGDNLDTGSVIASFSNGDPPLSMLPIGSGRWSATWLPAGSTASTSVTVDAKDPVSKIQGSSGLTGGVNAPMDAPVIRAHGVASSANGDTASPFAPGSLISITGTNLASGTAFANSPPLPNSLNGTSVLVAGMPAPLSAVSPQEIDAILPSNLTANTTQQVLIVRGDSFSIPQAISVAPAQPAIFVMGAQAAVVDAQFRLLGPQNPAKPGDTIIVFAAGLGSTNPSVDAGSTAPSTVLAVAANPVSATVGGESAQVSYAGLAPGLVGIYQINLVIAPDLPASAQTPLTIVSAGLSSAVISIPVAP